MNRTKTGDKLCQ